MSEDHPEVMRQDSPTEINQADTVHTNEDNNGNPDIDMTRAEFEDAFGEIEEAESTQVQPMQFDLPFHNK